MRPLLNIWFWGNSLIQVWFWSHHTHMEYAKENWTPFNFKSNKPWREVLDKKKYWRKKLSVHSNLNITYYGTNLTVCITKYEVRINPPNRYAGSTTAAFRQERWGRHTGSTFMNYGWHSVEVNNRVSLDCLSIRQSPIGIFLWVKHAVETGKKQRIQVAVV